MLNNIWIWKFFDNLNIVQSFALQDLDSVQPNLEMHDIILSESPSYFDNVT